MTECKCGCGGTPNKGKIFIRGHYARTAEARAGYTKRRKKVSGNPSKYCKCGCGGIAPIVTTDGIDRGYRTGQRAFYIVGHAAKNKKGSDAPRWKGGRFLNGYGYYEIHSPEHPHCNGKDYVLEHRLVMEKKLGRYLDPEERVHHINGVRTDNRVKNLVVITRSDHAKIHAEALVRWRAEDPERWKRHNSEAGRKGAAARWGKHE